MANLTNPSNRSSVGLSCMGGQGGQGGVPGWVQTLHTNTTSGCRTVGIIVKKNQYPYWPLNCPSLVCFCDLPLRNMTTTGFLL